MAVQDHAGPGHEDLTYTGSSMTWKIFMMKRPRSSASVLMPATNDI
jgi:hypothetical protein